MKIKKNSSQDCMMYTRFVLIDITFPSEIQVFTGDRKSITQKCIKVSQSHTLIISDNSKMNKTYRNNPVL